MTQASQTAINQLEEVFAAFNQVSSELGERYRQLEGQVAILNRELANAHSDKLRELAEKERLAARLAALMDALPGGVLVLNGAGRIRQENPAAREILGASFVGRSWDEALRHCSSADSRQGEIALNDGRRISITSRAGESHGETVILLTDVSENHRLNEMINREKRLTALGEMSARLAHQVRTPLSSAILYLSHLSSPLPGMQREEVIGKVFERLRQIENLVDGMLRFIRGGIDAETAFSLKEVLDAVRDCMRPQLEQSGGALEVHLPEGDRLIHGNRDALCNALLNLVENALQAGATWISIELLPGHGWHEIHVADNGSGIPRDLREQVFDPFFSTRPRGTGLGLAVVASAVQAHGGEIEILDGVPRGTVFQLKLPRRAPDAAAPPIANAEKEQVNG